jgi:hypothetical protein
VNFDPFICRFGLNFFVKDPMFIKGTPHYDGSTFDWLALNINLKPSDDILHFAH